MKLDAKFQGSIFKVKDGALVPPDEYVVFLIKDNAFWNILQKYRDECVAIGCDQEQIDSIDRMIERGRIWRKHNPGRLKKPDAKGEALLG